MLAGAGKKVSSLGDILYRTMPSRGSLPNRGSEGSLGQTQITKTFKLINRAYVHMKYFEWLS